jgi:hypothetical protein
VKRALEHFGVAPETDVSTVEIYPTRPLFSYCDSVKNPSVVAALVRELQLFAGIVTGVMALEALAGSSYP